ncbi:hypothetical protein BGZ79_010548 [Entomortierella chlamydospora]|nr:hypothetical protein BGZ79_010548 [Entomortierella chlamydospora]
MGSSGPDSEDDKSLYFGQNDQQRLHQSVSQLRVTDGENSPPHSLPRYGMVLEQRQQELFQRRFMNESDNVDELGNSYRRHHIRGDSREGSEDGAVMIVEPRFASILIILTAGGLVLTSSRYRGSSEQGPIAVDILDQVENEEYNVSAIQNVYNYCHAQRPAVETYPESKIGGSTLVNSQLFIRHGDRTPTTVLSRDLDVTWECANTSAYAFTGIGTNQGEKAPFQYANVVAHQAITIPPASPFAATKMWMGSCIPGQLTPVGAMQHRRLGAALRQIYVDELKFLPATFDPETVHIRSTDVWRTKQSAENLMAGLYGVQSHSPESPPPVLQIHILPAEIDYLTMNTGACPRISQLRSKVEKSSEVLKKLRKDNVDFNKELAEILGEERSWSGYMDTVMPRICHGMELQCRQGQGEDDDKCITPQIANRILENVGIETTEIYRDGKGVFEVLQLGIGPLTNDIKQNLLKAKANGKIRFSFYSGHDTTISPLLGMLDALDQRWPPYASSVLIELWKSPGGQHYVRVLYNGAILPTKSRWCDLEWCPLDAFISYIDRFIVEDLTTSCKKE